MPCHNNHLFNSLIGSMYPTAPNHAYKFFYSDNESYKSMLQTVAECGKYFYTFAEYLSTSLLLSCCCCRGRCFRKCTCLKLRKARYDRH